MSTLTKRGLIAVLTAATLSTLVLLARAQTDDRTPAEAPPARPAAAPREQYLLLTDGRLIHGVVSRQDSSYVVSQKLGVIRFPERLVEGAFDSVRAAYDYRLDQLPDRDPAECMKLAQWCLGFGMAAEAKAQLVKVLELSPGHAPAQAMLAKIDRQGLPASGPAVDRDVQQTAAADVEEDRPGALDSAVLRRAQRGMGLSGLPVIFDLPQAVAVRRADEFARLIHPILQAKCAGCHDGSYNGSFQLVTARTRRDQTPDALRANLDATLRLIDPVNPARSELLSSTLRPHGIGPKNRPIFAGSNDRAYQVLAAWVNSLRSATKSDDAARLTAFPGAQGVPETFAADRIRGEGGDVRAAAPGFAPPKAATGFAPTQAGGPGTNPAYRFIPGRGMLPEDQLQVDPNEFPAPFMLGGPHPAIGNAATKDGNRPSGGTPTRSAGAKAQPQQPSRGPVPRDAAASKASAPDASNTPPADSSKPSAATAGTKSSAPVKIDPALLERFLRGSSNQ
jgi:hypothetical protein